ncbi:GGLO oxidase, partial [Corvus moneduloides]|nr:GGLO oxidase [Corvus moneduloides]
VEFSSRTFAIPSLGAVSEVTAAGVIGTGTHNTGIDHGILPTQVVALSLLLASGEILECSDSVNPDIFQAARLHLGCLGIVLSVTFQCVPQFRLREVAFPSTLSQVLDQLEEHLRRSQYFRFLWFPHSENVRIIYQDPTSKPPCSSSSWFWDYAVGYYLLEFLLWIRDLDWGPHSHWNISMWIPPDPHPRVANPWKEGSGLETPFPPGIFPCGSLQIPIPRSRIHPFPGLPASPNPTGRIPGILLFPRAISQPCPSPFPGCCCFPIPLSRPYGKDFPRLEYWRTYERIMKKHGGRPHWAKAHSCTRKDLEKMYPAFPKFCAIREKLDPTGIFLNAYLEKVFY